MPGDLPLGLGDGRAGADGLLEGAEVAADVADQGGQGPARGGRDRDRQVGARQDVGEQIGLGDDLVAEAVVFQAWHRSAARLFAVRP